MPNQDLVEALDEIEQLLHIQPPIGAAELPPGVRYFRVLAALRDRLCPGISTTLEALKTPTGEIATVIADCLLSSMSQLPVPVATVARHVAALGVDKFCSDPSELVG